MTTWYDQLVCWKTLFFLELYLSRIEINIVFHLSQDCWTALISAAKEGHTEVVKELLENNANVEHRDMVRAKYIFLPFLFYFLPHNIVNLTSFTLMCRNEKVCSLPFHPFCYFNPCFTGTSDTLYLSSAFLPAPGYIFYNLW